MKADKSNTWLNQDLSQLDLYISSSDVILIERNRTQKIVLDLFRYHFRKTKGLNILDLGCGDGILTQCIRKRYPDNIFSLMDGSPGMITRAKENLSGNNLIFIQKTFEEYIDSPAEDQKYDFVHSANAIHHLDLVGKEGLFSKVYSEMRYNGLFINIDPVKPSSKRSERWQFMMWTDWMNETLYKNDFQDDCGKYDHIPITYKNKEENKPSTLCEQLEILTKIGFNDVDCFYKYGVFALFGGTKQDDRSPASG